MLLTPVQAGQVSSPNFVSDTFTDSDGTLLTAHVGEIGATWTKPAMWLTSNGLFKIGNANDVYYATTDGINGEVGFQASGLPAGAQYDITTPLRVLTNSGSQRTLGVTARGIQTALDPSHYRWIYDNVTGIFTMEKVTSGGATSSLGTFNASLAAGLYSILFQIRNATKKLFIDGVERISSGDNALSAAGQVGLYSGTRIASTNLLGINLESITAANV